MARPCAGRRSRKDEAVLALRSAVEADLDLIRSFVRELADY